MNKENRHLADSSEQESDTSPSLKEKRTSEYSIQVNMEAETESLQYLMNPAGKSTKKKQKRKQYRKRRKEKFQEYEKIAKVELQSIVSKILNRQTQFEREKIRVQNCFYYLQSAQKFHLFLNQVIRFHVTNVQKTIWQYTQQILHENVFQESGTHEFYLQMVRKIYQEYLNVRVASIELEKLINCFMRMTSSNDPSESYKYLDRTIFNFLIQSDQTLKNLLKICDKKVEPQHIEERACLNKILDIVNYFEPLMDYDDFDEDSQDFYNSEEGDSIMMNSSLEETKTTNQKKRKKKRITEQDLKSEYEDVIARAQSLLIDEEERVRCVVTEEWLEEVTKTIYS